MRHRRGKLYSEVEAEMGSAEEEEVDSEVVGSEVVESAEVAD